MFNVATLEKALADLRVKCVQARLMPALVIAGRVEVRDDVEGMELGIIALARTDPAMVPGMLRAVADRMERNPQGDVPV